MYLGGGTVYLAILNVDVVHLRRNFRVRAQKAQKRMRLAHAVVVCVVVVVESEDDLSEPFTDRSDIHECPGSEAGAFQYPLVPGGVERSMVKDRNEKVHSVGR